jgi:23S rRNA (pseudouridine1915-N3)-methyltransferase
MTEGRDLDFVIGGADGLDPEIKNQADKMLSLSLMTYPHALARLILIEQLYRAQCIIKKHPYHRD